MTPSITGPPNRPVLFCSLASVVDVVVIVCNAAVRQVGRPPGAWAVGWAGRVGGRAADTAWRASRVTSR